MKRYWTLAINYNASVAYSRKLENTGFSWNRALLRHLNQGFKTQNSLSTDSSRKLCKSVNKLLNIARTKRVFNSETKEHFKFKVAFLTLTLPSTQVHSDKEIKQKCFLPFMDLLQKSYSLRYYVWRAERQDNGNIHFHLVTDKFIPHSDLRNKWNSAINKLHYVDTFYLNHGHYNPNTTDIDGVRDLGSVGGYISKYFSKNKKVEDIEGRFYSQSHALSKYKPYSIDEFHLRFDEIKSYLDDNMKVPLEQDYCSIFRFGKKELLNLPTPDFVLDWINYHQLLDIPVDISESKWQGLKRFNTTTDKYTFGNFKVYEYRTEVFQFSDSAGK